VEGLSLALPLCDHGSARDLLPDLEFLGHLLAIPGGGEAVASRSEVLGDGPMRGQKALRMSRRLESLHAPFALAGQSTARQR
jgi:hypothetical protein